MKKHVAVVSQYYYPEAFRINDICESLVSRGFDVTVITGIPNYPEGKFYKGFGWFKRRKETYNGVRIIRLPIISRGKSKIRLILNYYSFVISGWLFKTFSRLKADIVYTHEVSPMMQAYVGKWLAKKWQVPSVLCVQDLWPESVESTVGLTNKRIIKHLEKQSVNLYKAYDHILVSSKSYVPAITKHGISVDKIQFWPQYAEDFYRPSELKSTLIPQDGRLNITFTGNVGTAQGLSILPKAAELLKQEGLGRMVRFNIVGDGRFKEELTRIVSLNESSDMFNFIDRQQPEDIPSILAASDAAFLSFAPKELFSMIIPAKLQSYLACGLPIIGSVSGESAEIIKQGNVGYVSPTGDTRSLANNIRRFLKNDENEKLILKKNAIDYSIKQFNKNKLLKDLSVLLSNLV